MIIKQLKFTFLIFCVIFLSACNYSSNEISPTPSNSTTPPEFTSTKPPSTAQAATSSPPIPTITATTEPSETPYVTDTPTPEPTSTQTLDDLINLFGLSDIEEMVIDYSDYYNDLYINNDKINSVKPEDLDEYGLDLVFMEEDGSIYRFEYDVDKAQWYMPRTRKPIGEKDRDDIFCWTGREGSIGLAREDNIEDENPDYMEITDFRTYIIGSNGGGNGGTDPTDEPPPPPPTPDDPTPET